MNRFSMNRGLSTLRSFTLAAFACLGLAVSATAATVIWTSSIDGAWTNAAGWTPPQVPGPGDTAVVGGPTTVTLGGDVSVQTLNLTGGGLTGAGTFHGVLNWSGGGGNGALNAVNLTIAHGSQLNLLGNADKLLVVGVITNHGIITWTNGGSFKFGFDQAYVRNEADGEFRIQSASFLGGNPQTDNDGAYIYNSGLMTCDIGAGTNMVSVGRGTFVNNGVLRVLSGTMVFTDGLVSTGTGNEISVANTSVLEVSAGGHPTLFADTTFSGTGPHRLKSGNMTMTGGIQATNVILAGATLQGGASSGGQTLLSGVLSWQYGDFTDLALTIKPDGELDLTGAGLKFGGNAFLTNHGQIAWTGPGDFKGSMQIVNATDGVFLVQSTGYLGGAPTGDNYFTKFENHGLWICDVGIGNQSYESAGHYTFPNTGRIEVRSGTLLLDEPFDSSGPGNELRVAAGAELDLPGSTSANFTDTVFSGAGLHRFYKVPPYGTGPVNWNGNIFCTNLVLDGRLLESAPGPATLHGTLNWKSGETSSLNLTVAPDGEIDLTGAGERNLLASSLTNRGRIVWQDTGNFRLNGGATFANDTNGVLLVQSTGFMGGDPAIDNNDARIFNFGTWVSDTGAGTNIVSLAFRPFINTGTLEIRSGMMRVFANQLTTGPGLDLPAGSLLRIDIGGTTPGTGFGQFQVMGSLTQNGQLQAVLVNGFLPLATDTFQILLANPASGIFSAFLGASLGNGLFFDPLYSTGGVTLRLIDNRPSLVPIPGRVTNGVFSLNLFGAISQPYDVEYTTNFSAWTLLGRFVPPASPMAVTDNTATNAMRFYRVKVASGP